MEWTGGIDRIDSQTLKENRLSKREQMIRWATP
jgi:hypothetical protein